MKTIGKIFRELVSKLARHVHLGKFPACLALLAAILALLTPQTLASTFITQRTFVQQDSLISSLSGTNSATNAFLLNVAGNTNLPVALSPAFSVSGIGSQGLTLIVKVLASHAAGTTNNGTINLLLAPSVNSATFATGNTAIIYVPHNGVTAYTWATNIPQSVFGAVDSIRLYNITTTNIGTFSISNVLARAILTTY